MFDSKLVSARCSCIELDRLLARGKKAAFDFQVTPLALKAKINLIKDSNRFRDEVMKTDGSESKGVLGITKPPLLRGESFEPDEASVDRKEEVVRASDVNRNSISMEIDVLEFMKDPQSFPEVN